MLSTLATPEGLAYATAVAGGVAIVVRTFLKGIREGERAPTKGTTDPAPPPPGYSSNGEARAELTSLVRQIEQTLDRVAEFQAAIRDRSERDNEVQADILRTLERSERILARMEESSERMERTKRAEASDTEIMGKMLAQIRDLLKGSGGQQ